MNAQAHRPSGGRGRPRGWARLSAQTERAERATRTCARRTGDVTVDLRLERHGRGAAQPADLRRRRDAHGRSGPRRDRPGRRQRPPRRRRHVGPVRFALRAAGLGRRRLRDLAHGGLRHSLGGRLRRESRARASTPRTSTVYANPGARVRVNADPRRGTAVVVRAGSVEVRTPRRLLHRARRQLPARRTARRSPRSRAAASRATASTSGRPTASRPPTTRRTTPRASTSARTTPATSRRSTATATGTTTRPTRATSGGRSVAAGWTPYSNGTWYYTPAGLTWWSLGSVGLVPVPLRQLVLRLRLEQLVLVARLRLLARVGLLGLHVRLRRLVPDRLLRRLLLALVEQLLPQLGLSPERPRVRDQRQLLDAPRGHPRLELHRHRTASARRAAAWTSSRARASSTGSADRSRSPRGRSSSPRAPEPASASRCATTCARRRASSSARPAATPTRLEPVLARDRELPSRHGRRAARPHRRRRARPTDRPRRPGPRAPRRHDRGPRTRRDADREHPAHRDGPPRPAARCSATAAASLRPSPPTAGSRLAPRVAPHGHADPRTTGGAVPTSRSPPAAPPPRRPARAPSPRRPSPGATAPGPTQPQAGSPQPGQRFESDQKPAANDWRSRGQVPPARRVIEGAVPGRRSPEPGNGGSSALARLHSARGSVGAARKRAALRRPARPIADPPRCSRRRLRVPSPRRPRRPRRRPRTRRRRRTPHRLRGPRPRRRPAAAATARRDGPESIDLSEVSSSFHRAFGRGFFSPVRPGTSARAPGRPG